jgi:hypothetical protein
LYSGKEKTSPSTDWPKRVIDHLFAKSTNGQTHAYHYLPVRIYPAALTGATGQNQIATKEPLPVVSRKGLSSFVPTAIALRRGTLT